MTRIREAVGSRVDRSWASRGLAVWLAFMVAMGGLGGVVLVEPDYSAVGDALAAGTFDGFEDGDATEWDFTNTDATYGVQSTTVGNGSYSLRVDDGAGTEGFYRTFATDAYSEGSVMFRYDNLSASPDNPLFKLYGTFHASVKIKDRDTILNHDGGAYKAHTLQTTLSDNTWYHFRIYDIDYSTDTFSLQILSKDGTILSEHTGLSSRYAGSDIDTWDFQVGDGGSGIYMDDVQIGQSTSPTYTVSGTVNDTDGDPISGATVSTGGGTSTTTAADGSWSMDLEDGTYTLTASQSGYTSQSQTVTVNGGPVSGVEHSLVGQLRGYVRDGENDNTPLSGATVETSGGTTDTTNSTGFWSLPLTDGTYTVKADHPDYTAFQDDITVGGATSYNYTLCQSGCTSTGNKTGVLYTQEFILNDSTGKFEGNNPQLRIYTYNGGDLATPGVSTSDWLLAHSTGFNHDQKAYADITDGEIYKLEVRTDEGQWDMIGYRADVSSGATTLSIGGETTDDLISSGDSSGGSGGSSSDGSTSTPFPDGSTHTATPADGYGPTIVGDCQLDGEDGIRIEYYDPDGGTYTLDYNLTDDSGTVYEGTKDFSDGPVGYYWGCVLDTVTQNASEGVAEMNWTARDENGTVLDNGEESASSPPMFGPSGNAPSSTGERLGLIGGLLGVLGALWVGGRRYVPAEGVAWWPSETVSPVFAVGAPVATLLALDISGGGVISASVSWAVARVAPLGMIVGGGLAAYYIWVWIQPGPMN